MISAIFLLEKEKEMIKRTKEEWREIITRWEKSNLSMAAYCRQNEINYWTFRQNIHKQTTRSPLQKSNNAPLVKITNCPSIPKSAAPPSITVFISEKYRLEIPDGFNKDTLQRVVDVLGARI